MVQGHSNWSKPYQENGFISPVHLISEDEALANRQKLEEVERVHGSLHYISKVHTILDFAAELATQPKILDVVEQLIGPDIMLFDVTYIIKEANNAAHVSWHQDLTYWGFSNDQQVSMWLALSPASEQSGCMRMIPKSHKNGQLVHHDEKDETNVLFRGQTVKDVAEETSIMCPLKPGEASFHHGWTLHASMPNNSDDRRIGFNVQYISPSIKQLINKNETATLVRGEDKYHHYSCDQFASGSMLPDDLERHKILEIQRKNTWANA